MNVQNDILDYLGGEATEEDLRKEFSGKTTEEILEILNGWFSQEDNQELAQNITDYLHFN